MRFDVQFLVLFIVIGVVGGGLAWVTGARNGTSPTPGILCTALVIATSGYTWCTIHQQRGTRFIRTGPAVPPPTGAPRPTATGQPDSGPNPADRQVS